MSTQAEIKSIETLAFVKAALASFAQESGQAIGEVELQASRIVDWICIDQAAYWKVEVRKAADGVNQAIKDLQHCKTYKKVGDKEPSCIEEKKALEKARRRLERAERKAEAVRRWTPVVRKELDEANVRLARFREVIDIDCPKALTRLERMLRALDGYTHSRPPAAAGGPSEGKAASVARAVTEPPAEAPAPAAPPPPVEGGP